MADTYTANYNFTKPQVNGSRDTWGGKDNENLDKIDTALKALSDTKLPWDQVAKAVTTQVDFTNAARPKVTGARTALDAAPTEVATIGDVLSRVPIGLISLWYGVVANIPAGWALCNGANGTPDLRDRFVRGAGLNFVPGVVGGAAAHAHTINPTVLTVAQMPSHAHSVGDPGHTHAVADPGHSHSYTNTGNNIVGFGGNIASINAGYLIPYVDKPVTASGTNISLYSAYTGISIAANGGNEGHTHSMAAVDSSPPYMALCYIMKIAG